MTCKQRYATGSSVKFHYSVFHAQGPLLTGIITNYNNNEGEYEIESNDTYFWRTESELHEAIFKEMYNAVSDMVEL